MDKKQLTDTLTASPVDVVIDAVAAWAAKQFPQAGLLITALDSILKALADKYIP